MIIIIHGVTKNAIVLFSIAADHSQVSRITPPSSSYGFPKMSSFFNKPERNEGVVMKVMTR